MTGLERDLQYQFRVTAKTAVNISKPSEPTDPVLVCAENGEFELNQDRSALFFKTTIFWLTNESGINYICDLSYLFTLSSSKGRP